MKKVIINEIEKTYSATFYTMSCGGLSSRKFTVLSGENPEEKAKELYKGALDKISLSTTQVKYLFDLDGEKHCVYKSWMEPYKKIGDTITILEDGDCWNADSRQFETI